MAGKTHQELQEFPSDDIDIYPDDKQQHMANLTSMADTLRNTAKEAEKVAKAKAAAVAEVETTIPTLEKK